MAELPIDNHQELAQEVDVNNHRLRDLALFTIIAVEVNPVTNEGIRFGSLIYAMNHYGHNTLISALALGGTTLLVEGAGALAGAEVIGRDNERTPNRFTNWFRRNVSDRIQKKLPEDAELPLVVEGSTAMVLGTVATTFAKQQVEPERTLSQRRERGLITAALMAGYFAVEGALINDGVEHYTDPRYVIPAVGVVAASLFGTSKILSSFKKKRGF